MLAKLYIETFEQLIVRTDEATGFKILINDRNDVRRRHSPKNVAQSTIHPGSTMMWNRPSEEHRKPMKRIEWTSMKKQMQNISKPRDKWK